MEVPQMRLENDEAVEKNKEVRCYAVNRLRPIMEQSNWTRNEGEQENMTRIELKYKTKNCQVKIKEDSFTIHSDTLAAIYKVLELEKASKGGNWWQNHNQLNQFNPHLWLCPLT